MEEKKQKKKQDESRFLEAPFVCMLRMRSASLKIEKPKLSPRNPVKLLSNINCCICYPGFNSSYLESKK